MLACLKPQDTAQAGPKPQHELAPAIECQLGAGHYVKPSLMVHTVSDHAVQDFYSVLRYPGPKALVTYLWARRISSYLPSDRPVNLLDAGCGSGRHTAGILDIHKQARVIGLDVSAPSLAEASALCTQLGHADRVQFVQGSYLDPIELSEPVDGALAIGTIHHSSDPSRALKNIVATVRPGGFVAVMVYSIRSARRRYELKEALQILNPPRDRVTWYFHAYQRKYESWRDISPRATVKTLKNKLSLKIKKILGLKRHGYYAGLDSDLFRQDAMLNPIDTAFDAVQLQELIESAGLQETELLSFGKPDPNKLPAEWGDLWSNLPFWDQVRIMELIDPMPQSWSFICRKPA